MFRIAGRVVSAVDGHPLQRATVRILTTGDSKLLASTVAGEEGEFTFANVKGGSYYVLEGSASGFIGTRYDGHGIFSTAIINGPGLDTESLVLKLTPEAGISGRVTDEAGDPVRHASLTLYRESGETGIPRTTRMRNAQTDDTGAYEILNLPPGRYFLSATATPWYAVHPQTLSGGAGDPTSFQYLMPGVQGGTAQIVDSVDTSLDVAYPVTFYPYATDSSGASPIPLKAGDQREIDIPLTPQTAMTITIPHASGNDLPPPPPGDRAAQMAYARAIQPPQVQLQRKVFDTLEPVNTETRFSSNAMSIVGVPPGQYVLQEQALQMANVPADAQAPRFARSATVDLTARSAQVDLASGAASGKVKLKFKTTDGALLPAQTEVVLRRQDPKQPPIQGRSNEQGDVEFASVDPGDYLLFPTVGNKRYLVTKLMADGRTLPSTILHVTAGATASVTAIAEAVSGNLEGFARIDGKPAPGARVVLLPEDLANRAWFIREDQSDLDGSFHLKDVAPGRYTLMAIENGWEIEWMRESAFDHYLPLGVAIVIPNSGNTSVKLPDVLTVQAQ